MNTSSAGELPDPAGDWIIRRGEEQFKAPDLQTLREWYGAGRVVDSDFVFHPSLGDRWHSAVVLRQAPGPAVPEPRASSKKVWLVPLAGCGVLFVTALLIGAFTAVGGAAKKALAGPPALIVADATADDDGGTWTKTVRVINVTDQPISDLTLNVDWKLKGKTLSSGFGKLRQPLKPGELAVVTATGEFEERLPLVPEPALEDFLPKSQVDRAFLKSYEQEEIMHSFMKQQETVQHANAAIMQSIYQGLEIEFTNSNGDAVGFKAIDAKLTPHESRIVDVAFKRFELATEADAQRRRDEESARVARDREKRRNEAIAGAINRLRVAANPIMNDALSIVRRQRARVPSEEAIYRRNIERVLDREMEKIRLQFAWDEEEARAQLEPIKTEVLARWDSGLDAAARDVPR